MANVSLIVALDKSVLTDHPAKFRAADWTSSLPRPTASSVAEHVPVSEPVVEATINFSIQVTLGSLVCPAASAHAQLRALSPSRYCDHRSSASRFSSKYSYTS